LFAAGTHGFQYERHGGTYAIPVHMLTVSHLVFAIANAAMLPYAVALGA
jgi:hypothetical protein